MRGGRSEEKIVDHRELIIGNRMVSERGLEVVDLFDANEGGGSFEDLVGVGHAVVAGAAVEEGSAEAVLFGDVVDDVEEVIAAGEVHLEVFKIGGNGLEAFNSIGAGELRDPFHDNAGEVDFTAVGVDIGRLAEGDGEVLVEVDVEIDIRAVAGAVSLHREIGDALKGGVFAETDGIVEVEEIAEVSTEVDVDGSAEVDVTVGSCAEIDGGVDIEFVSSAAEIGGEGSGADAIEEEAIVAPFKFGLNGDDAFKGANKFRIDKDFHIADVEVIKIDTIGGIVAGDFENSRVGIEVDLHCGVDAEFQMLGVDVQSGTAASVFRHDENP